jgi:hypothetical protein
MAWSYSSYTSFNRCKRQYFYSNEFAHHNAKKCPLKREAHLLKQLTHGGFWTGKVAEAALEDILIKDRPPRSDISHRLYEYAVELAKRQMAYSLSGDFRRVVKSSVGREYFRLLEHEYGLDDSGLLESTIEELKVCFEHYPTIQLKDLGISLNSLLLSTATKRCQEVISTRLFETPIQCNLDCLIEYGSKLIVIDWKVSRTSASDFSKQLLTYGLVVSRTRGSKRALNDILIYEINLLQGKVTPYRLDEVSIAETEDFIFDSVKMIERVTERRGRNDLDPEDFPPCENIRVCEFCNFQKICTW